MKLMLFSVLFSSDLLAEKVLSNWKGSCQSIQATAANHEVAGSSLNSFLKTCSSLYSSQQLRTSSSSRQKEPISHLYNINPRNLGQSRQYQPWTRQLQFSISPSLEELRNPAIACIYPHQPDQSSPHTQSPRTYPMICLCPTVWVEMGRLFVKRCL